MPTCGFLIVLSTGAHIRVSARRHECAKFFAGPGCNNVSVEGPLYISLRSNYDTLILSQRDCCRLPVPVPAETMRTTGLRTRLRLVSAAVASPATYRCAASASLMRFQGQLPRCGMPRHTSDEREAVWSHQNSLVLPFTSTYRRVHQEIGRPPDQTAQLHPDDEIVGDSDAPFGTLLESPLPLLNQDNDATCAPASASSSSSDSPTNSVASLIGKYATIRRVFGSRSNAEVMLTCGGSTLAKHASFDPNYHRAQQWIRSHAVGPAVLSPVLLIGLIGSLVEATFPQSTVPVGMTFEQSWPLIVGVPVHATITVSGVQESSAASEDPVSSSSSSPQMGYQVQLDTAIARARDGLVLATGTYTIWIPDYVRK
jgi:hypothetical protein